MKMNLSAATLWVSLVVLLGLVMADQSFAGFFEITPVTSPPPPPPPAAPPPVPVPEIDGPSGIAAIALLASLAVILLSKWRNRQQ